MYVFCRITPRIKKGKFCQKQVYPNFQFVPHHKAQRQPQMPMGLVVSPFPDVIEMGITFALLNGSCSCIRYNLMPLADFARRRPPVPSAHR